MLRHGTDLRRDGQPHGGSAKVLLPEVGAGEWPLRAALRVFCTGDGRIGRDTGDSLAFV